MLGLPLPRIHFQLEEWPVFLLHTRSTVYDQNANEARVALFAEDLARVLQGTKVDVCELFFFKNPLQTDACGDNFICSSVFKYGFMMEHARVIFLLVFPQYNYCDKSSTLYRSGAITE